MKHIVEVSCDGATLCFFDPAALPSNFDDQVKDDFVELMEQLQKQQVLWFSDIGGDGTYTFHVYIDEDAPQLLRSKAVSVNSFEAFSIPSGQLCICGAEYAANDPLVGSQFTSTGGFTAYPNMGDIIELATGDYCMELLEIEWSNEDWKSAQEAVVPKNQLRRYRRLEMLTAFCFLIGSITLLFSVPLLLKTVYDYFFQSSLNNCSTTQLQQIWLPTVVVVLAGGSLFGLGLLSVRCRSRSVLTQLLATVAQEMPNYVLIAKRRVGL